jgi:hypothetical protein
MEYRNSTKPHLSKGIASMETYYIELTIERRGQIYCRYSIPTDIRSIWQVLGGLGSQRHLTFEEGQMAR